MTQRRIFFFLIAPLIIGLVVLAGCGGGGGSADVGTGQLQVTLVDAPLNADEINVEITSVQAHSSEAGWQVVREYAEPLRVNLLDYSSSGSSLLLADTPLAAGHYTMMRLMISSADIVIGGVTYDVDISNVTQTGVKANGQFTIGEGEMVALVLDFNAGKSFVNNPVGSNNYKLNPVMTMSPVSIASEVSGSVVFQDGNGTPVDMPGITVVDVYTAGHIGDAEFLVSGAMVDTDGTFKIGILPQGTYDIEVIVEGAVVKQLAGVSITPPATDLGELVVEITQPAPE